MTPTAPTEAVVADDVAVEQMLLQDGEIVVLSLRPSPWYVLLVSAPVVVLAGLVAAVAALVQAAGMGWGDRSVYLVCAVVAGLRVVVACVQCVGLRYVLTSRRILRLRTLLSTSAIQFPLELVEQANVAAGVGERLLRVGDMVFVDREGRPFSEGWRCVSQPAEVGDLINETIRRYRLS